ncbi:hypothetical protein PEDI_17500 [Persicobacter diffluens]|uniref:Uncharacterized protein n=1 Tax=Persicobacter diffluens TaxID=981 RepID=A0AAN5ALT0_9BACT|nr:hypothetical protein PEDI_17500 [Persicobacter diffluens]
MNEEKASIPKVCCELLIGNVTENMMDADHPVWSFQEHKSNHC